MSFLTILLFFIYTIGLGFTLTSLFKIKTKDFYEKLFMQLGLGLAVFAVLTALIPLLRIPLDWRVILLLSVIYPIYYFIRNHNKIIKILKSKEFHKEIRPSITILVLIILFGFTFFMYHKGAFSYPYLENDDPWDHALSIKYIALEKTVYEPEVDSYFFNYLDSRPPAYDAILGVLHQTSPSIQWTMKFFNALIISLGILFFFYFAKKMFNSSSNKALLATFFLAMSPTYLTHFIWSHGLVMTLMFVGLYAFLSIDNRWNTKLIAMFTISSVFLTQESESIKYIIILGLFFLARSLIKKKVDLGSFYTILGSGLIASIVWWIPMYFKYGGIKEIYTLGILHGRDIGNAASSYIHPSIEGVKLFGTLGSATRQHGIYTLKDILFAKGQNMINVPIGVGFVLVALIVIGAIYLIIKNRNLLKAKSNELALLLCFIFVFFGTHGGTRWWSPIALFTFRFWLLFAIFGSLVAVYGAYFLFSLAKQFKIPKITVIILIVICVWFTSGAQKYELNTSNWYYGGSWNSPEELQGYIWFKEQPVDTKVFVTHRYEWKATGFDMYSCGWCKDEREFKASLSNKTINEISSWLKSKNYEYIVFDAMTFREYGQNETNSKVSEMINSDLFPVSFQNKGVIIFKVL